MKKVKRKSHRMTPPMLAEKYSGSERLEATAANFPALKNFWDMNNISGAYLMDTVGTQHVWSDHGGWFLDGSGFSKYTTEGGNYTDNEFEAPGNRSIVVIGSGLVTLKDRPITIGNLCSTPEVAPGIAVHFGDGIMNPAYLDAANNAAPAEVFSFANEFESLQEIAEDGHVYPNAVNPGIWGCFATVIDTVTGTCNTYWGGRLSDTASYNVPYETHGYTVTGSLQGPWPALGNCWTTYPANRFEWVALMYFESGAPNDMQAAMEWMAQHDDIRMFPGWKGKQ